MKEEKKYIIEESFPNVSWNIKCMLCESSSLMAEGLNPWINYCVTAVIALKFVQLLPFRGHIQTKEKVFK